MNTLRLNIGRTGLALIALVLHQSILQQAQANSFTNTASLIQGRYNYTATCLADGRVLVAGGQTSSGALSTAELYDQDTGTWTNTGSLPSTRYHHTATLLTNGQVLVAGGYGSGGHLASAVLYNPATGSWTNTGSLAANRRLHTATLLPNGKVLAAGGWGTAGYLSSAELYDTATGSWTNTGAMTTNRYWHTATLLANGQVLAVGGYGTGGYRSSSELYNPATGIWTASGSMATARYVHIAALLPNGKVLVGGGANSTNSYLSCATLYDPALGTWTNCAPMSGGRAYHAAACLANGRVLVAAGNGAGGALGGAELFDASLPANTWTTTDALSIARIGHTATLLPNGKVLVSGTPGETLSTELYEPANGLNGEWRSIDPMTIAHSSHTATLLANGQVLVTGGWLSYSSVASTALYDPFSGADGAWTVIDPQMSTARYAHTATLLLNKKVLVVGGWPGDITTAEVYDPVPTSQGAWTAAGTLTTAGRYAHTATLLPNGKVLVAGGYNSSDGVLSSAELYDQSNALEPWAETDPLAIGRHTHTATLLPNGKVLIAGGFGFDGAAWRSLSSAVLYDPSNESQPWGAAQSMPTARYFHTETLLPNGTVLVAGGYDTTSGYLDSSHLYIPFADTWTGAGDSLNTARGYHTATLLPNGAVLIACGYNNSLGYLDSAELYQTYTAYSLALQFPIAAPTLDQNQTLGGYSGNISLGSGVTFRPAQSGSEQDIILVLDNTSPQRVIQFTRTGVQPGGSSQRQINLVNFNDPEDIHWLGDPNHPDWYVISQEENGTPTDGAFDEIVIVNIPYGTTGPINVDMNNANHVIRRLQISHNAQTGFNSGRNTGLESVVLLDDYFYFTTEFAPTEGASRWNVWRVANDTNPPDNATGTSTVTPIKMFNLPPLIGNRANDISGMSTDGTHLWLVSHEVVTGAPRGRVLKITTNGELVGDHHLPAFTHPSAGIWEQAEGIEVFTDPADGKMKIMLVGEINANAGGTGVDFMMLTRP